MVWRERGGNVPPAIHKATGALFDSRNFARAGTDLPPRALPCAARQPADNVTRPAPRSRGL